MTCCSRVAAVSFPLGAAGFTEAKMPGELYRKVLSDAGCRA